MSGSVSVTGVVELTDGRTLVYEEVGDPGGMPVFELHGTPGSRLSALHPDPKRVAAAGLRVVSYDRPGYGRSSRQAGRRIVDCVEDVAAIADRCGIDRFAVSGGSGGGPHALAVGARLPDRVTRARSDVGGAPYDAEDLDWFEGMDPANVRELGWAVAGESTLAPMLAHEAEQLLERLGEDSTAVLGDIELSAADRTVLQDPAYRQRLDEWVSEAFVAGISGWVDDDLAFVSPWGFDVKEISVPVEIRYGTMDVLAPPAHSRWLAHHIPHASVTVDTSAGHLSTPDQRLERLRAFAGI